MTCSLQSVALHWPYLDRSMNGGHRLRQLLMQSALFLGAEFRRLKNGDKSRERSGKAERHFVDVLLQHRRSRKHSSIPTVCEQNSREKNNAKIFGIYSRSWIDAYFYFGSDGPRRHSKTQSAIPGPTADCPRVHAILSATLDDLACASFPALMGRASSCAVHIGGNERPRSCLPAGLMMPCARKSVEPMAAVTAPERTSAQHQSLLHFVGEGNWCDEKVLAKVREMVLPEIERHGPIEAWIIDDTGSALEHLLEKFLRLAIPE
jgi:hypothetical protein